MTDLIIQEVGAEWSEAGEGIIMTVSIIMVIFGIITLIVGIGLWRMRYWAWIPAIILSILMLFSFPVGTIIGIFGLITLFMKDNRAHFRRMQRMPTKAVSKPSRHKVRRRK